MKPFLIRSTTRLFAFAVAFLLAACGGAPTGAAPPTLAPLARDTPAAAPTQPPQPSAAPSPAAAPTAAPAPTATSAPTAAAAPSAAPQPATAQASPANILISYHKSGGIAGVDETLTVYADGALEVRNKNRAVRSQAAPGDIQALQKLLGSSEFAALQLPVQPPVPDQFVYELTIPGRGKPIVAPEGANNPPVLRDLIDALERLKAQAK